MKCRLTRITDNGHTRTRVIEGTCDKEPAIGGSFVMFAEALDKSWGATMRLIETTEVRSRFATGKQVKFTTLNTEYVFEELE